MTFVVAGGRFVGVETLGGINDFVREALGFYPNLRVALDWTLDLCFAKDFACVTAGRAAS